MARSRAFVALLTLALLAVFVGPAAAASDADPTGYDRADFSQAELVTADEQDIRGAEFVPLPPTRIVDTRIGLGRPGSQRQPAGTFFDVTVAGEAGVPALAAGVVLNVTVTDAIGAGFVTVYASDIELPAVSNLNYSAGESVANQVWAALSLVQGDVRIFTNNDAHVVVDVSGYITSPAEESNGVRGSRLRTISPARLLDTRSGLGAPLASLGAGDEVTLQVTGSAVPSTATAVVLNLTGTNTTGDTFITAYPADGSRPNASSLNLRPGETRPNLVTVPLSSTGAVKLFNNAGNVDLIADVVAYFEPQANATDTRGKVVLLNPIRVFDSRADSGGPLAPASQRYVDFGNRVISGLSFDGAIMNVTATGGTDNTFITVYPGPSDNRGSTSSLNVSPGQTIPNLTITAVPSVDVGTGTDTGAVFTYNNAGTQDLIGDLTAIIIT